MKYKIFDHITKETPLSYKIINFERYPDPAHPSFNPNLEGYIYVEITACGDPDGSPTPCGYPDNPQVTMRMRIAMPSVSLH